MIYLYQVKRYEIHTNKSIEIGGSKMEKFKKGAEYKLLRRGGNDAKRTFEVLGISHSVMKIQIKIIGRVEVFDLKVDYKGIEYISLGCGFPMYENPSAIDIIEQETIK
jgi:hypothetical protein